MLPIDLWFNSHHNALFLCVFVSSIDFWVEWNKKKLGCFICLQMKLHYYLYCFVLALGAWLKRYISIIFFFFLDMRLLLKSLNGFLSVLRAIPKKNDLPLIMSTPFWPLRSSQPKRTSPTSAQDWRFSASCWQCCSPQPSWLTSSRSSGASLRAWPAAIPKCYVLSTPFFLVSWVSSQLSLVSCNDLFLNSHWKPDQLHTGKNTIWFLSEKSSCHTVIKL